MVFPVIYKNIPIYIGIIHLVIIYYNIITGNFLTFLNIYSTIAFSKAFERKTWQAQNIT